MVVGINHIADVECQILTFEDEGHGVGRPRNLRMLYARLAAFFGNAFEKEQQT